jgi:hypothetical protein
LSALLEALGLAGLVAALQESSVKQRERLALVATVAVEVEAQKTVCDSTPLAQWLSLLALAALVE